MSKPETTHDIQSIIDRVKGYYPDAKVELIQKAYDLAEQAHREQKRSSGDPYIIHPVEVASVLAEMKLDIASIITGLLHDTVEDTAITLETITKEFGKDVAELVDGVTKLNKITFKTSEEKQAENFRKMLLAMAKDIRVILVKLSDRLNNMRTLEFLPPTKQQSIAQETLDIYAPIANRLGISWIKTELEDLCLRYLHPDVYYKLAKAVSMTRKQREQKTEDICETLKQELEHYEIKAGVTGRAKHFFSIFKKMERRKVDYEQIFDVIAFRIVVDNITECYKALGVIHSAFKPVPGRFKDYIAMPKANGYQSLHTTVIGPDGEPVEIQIRTQEMHSIAESGIAAHWKYKEGKFGSQTKENVEWVNRLLQWHTDLQDPNEFIETVKIDLFAEDVFAFTPKGEVKQLPYGSTPLDFAYMVHTDVGHHCVGAKINGKIVPLKYRLKSGDIVEIVTSPTQQPSKDWLNVCKTSGAKAKIRAFIKQAERDRARALGQEMLEKSLKEFEVTPIKFEKSGDLTRAAQDFHCRSIDELYVALGYGRVMPDPLLRKLLPQEAFDKRREAIREEKDQSFLKKVLEVAKVSPKKKREGKGAIVVGDLQDVLIRFGKCCSPIPGDGIVGFITRGRGVTIHTSNCQKAIDTDEQRRVDVQWNKGQKLTPRHHVKIKILSTDEPGLLALMSQTISALGVNITAAHVRTTKDKKAIAFFDVEVCDTEQLHKVQAALESKKGVIAVERVRA